MTTREALDILNEPSRRGEGRFFGKYRGLVKDNKDPQGLGRIQVTVPAVSGMALNWALPCAPYAGPDVGFYTIPPLGAKVWIEFEGGNPDHPIWSGCFWQDQEVPSEVATNADDPSQVKVWKTRVATLWIDDTDQKGKVTLRFKDTSVSEPVTVTVVLDSTGLAITCEGSQGTSSINMTPQDIQTNSTTLETNTSKGTTVNAQETIDASAGTDMTLKASGKISATATGSASFEGADVTVNANNSLTLSATNSASFEASTSISIETASLSASATGSATVSSVGSTKVSGAASLTLAGASISFLPA